MIETHQILLEDDFFRISAEPRYNWETNLAPMLVGYCIRCRYCKVIYHHNEYHKWGFDDHYRCDSPNKEIEPSEKLLATFKTFEFLGKI